MLPHEGWGGCVPKPRKLSDASVRMAHDRAKLTWTMMGAEMLGRMCRATMRPEGAPTEWAASTYSISLVANTGPRATRAKMGV